MNLDAELDALGVRPERQEFETIAEVAGATWKHPRESWGFLYPVLSREAVEARSRPTEFERILARELQHLQEVCHRPRLHLRIEEERVSVGRARRFSSRATASLLAHPEDWEHCTPQHIQPRKVLAIQVDDEWDLYENRVAVRLVDHLLRYVSQRLWALGKLKRLVDEADHGTGVKEGGWRRQDRLRGLWNEQSAVQHNEGQLGETFRLIRSLYGRLLSLLDSPLYQRLPRAAHVPDHLHSTNILTNDSHYRHVARLWRLWLENAWKKPLSTDEKARRLEEDRRSCLRFAEMLVRRASDGQVRCADHPDGLNVAIDGRTVEMRVVLARVPNEDGKAAALWDLLRADSRPALVVGDPRELGDLSVALRRQFGGWERPRILPVSPWSLESTERVARLLQLELTPGRVCNYPASVVLTSGDGLPGDTSLQAWKEGTKVRVGCMARPDGAIRQLERVVARRGAEDRRRLSVPENRSLHLQALVEFLRGVEVDAPGLCFGCGAEGQLEVRRAKTPEDCTWWATCRSCDAEWGWRRCGTCQRRFLAWSPYPEEADEGVRTPEEMDLWYGREVRAEPCWKRGVSKWRCPHCGTCEGGKCARCDGAAQ